MINFEIYLLYIYVKKCQNITFFFFFLFERINKKNYYNFKKEDLKKMDEQFEKEINIRNVCFDFIEKNFESILAKEINELKMNNSISHNQNEEYISFFRSENESKEENKNFQDISKEFFDPNENNFYENRELNFDKSTTSNSKTKQNNVNE